MQHRHYNKYIHGWLEKIESNIQSYKSNSLNLSNEQKTEFITHQYELIMIIHKALNNRVLFAGAKMISSQQP
jgi:hypothetical protein